MRRMAWAALAAAFVIAGCGGSSSSSNGEKSATPTKSGGAAAGGGGSQTVQVAADPGGAFKFTTKTLKAKSGTVTFEFDNPSTTPHGFNVEGNGIEEKGTKVVTKGKASVTIKLKPGKYEFYCPVDAHRQSGMEGTLTVS